MDKVSQNPFSPLPSSDISQNKASAIPRPNDQEISQAPLSGIKRKAEPLSHEEGGINPQIIEKMLLKREGRRAEYQGPIIYEGEFGDEIPNGKGKLIFSDIRVYEGDIKNGYPHGVGQVTYFDGTYYKGTFKNGLPQGSGVFKIENGKKIEAVFKDGVYRRGHLMIAFKRDGSFYYGPTENRRGKGFSISHEGIKLSGSIENELFHGKVFAFEGKRLLFEGEFEKNRPIRGKRHYDDGTYDGEVDEDFNMFGKGKLVCTKDGSIIEGNFKKNGEFEGAITESDGKVYRGLFKDWGGRDGVARLEEPNGKVFEGSIVKGTPHGVGEYFYADGARLMGFFQAGQLIEGTILFGDGSTYAGFFKDEKMQGFGTYQDQNLIYEGEFFESNFEGYGKGIFSNGGTYEGLWLESRPYAYVERENPARSFDWIESGTIDTNKYEGLGDSKSGYGKIVYPNGSIYKGSIIDGLANGEGELVSLSGNKYVGAFYDGKPHGKGKISFKNYSYEGGFARGLFSGLSKEIEKTGSEEWIFEGNYSNGLRKGDGIMLFSNGLKLRLTFDDEGKAIQEKTFFFEEYSGKIGNLSVSVPLNEGKVLIVDPEGAYIIAKTVNGKIEEGKIYYTNGDTYTGELLKANDNPPSFLPEGTGIMSFKGRGVFTGRFKDGFPDVDDDDYFASFPADKADFFKSTKL